MEASWRLPWRYRRCLQDDEHTLAIDNSACAWSALSGSGVKGWRVLVLTVCELTSL